MPVEENTQICTALCRGLFFALKAAFPSSVTNFNIKRSS
jgi:hypothetical protein